MHRIAAKSRLLASFVALWLLPCAATSAAASANPIADVQRDTSLLLAARDQWSSAVSNEARLNAEQALIAVAAARMQTLQRLVESSPSAAMAQVLGRFEIATLPLSVRPYLEERRVVDGTLEVRWADYADHARRSDILRSSSGQWTLHYTRSPRGSKLRSGDAISVDGLVVGELMAVDPESTTTLSASATSAALPLPGVLRPQRVLVVPVTFASNASTPYSEADIRARIFDDANSYYRDLSEGRTSLAGDVLPWLTVSLDPSICDIESVADLADEAARAHGLDPADYDRLLYVMPGMSCGWAGLAVTGPVMTSTRTWLTSIEARVVIHELGHNFGLHHSRGRVCQGGEVWSTACSIYEYGDAFDIMGNARGSPFNALQMRRMGYLDGDAASGSTRVTSAGNYEIGAYAAQSSAPKGLRIPAGIDPATQLERTLYVTLRQAIGRDSGLIYGAGYDAQRTERGIEVNTGSEADGESYLLDATPLSKSGPSDLGDAAFVVGESFVDTQSGVTIAPVEVREGVAIVAVTLSTAPGTSPLPTPSDLPPIAADDAASMGSGSSISILVLANDYDPEGQPLAIVSMTQPKAGGVSTDGTGAVIYRAPRKFSGTDSFTYSVSDGHSTATATVTVSARSTAKPGRAR